MSKLKEAIKLINQYEFNNKGIDEWEQLKVLKTRAEIMDVILTMKSADKLTERQKEVLESLENAEDALFYLFRRNQNQSMLISDLKITNANYIETIRELVDEVKKLNQIINNL